jgi:hypothetical protein
MTNAAIAPRRWVAVLLMVALLAVVVSVPESSARTIDGQRTYRASAAPTACVVADQPTRFTVTLENTSRNNQQLGSARVTPGFPVAATPAPSVIVERLSGATSAGPAPSFNAATNTLELSNLSAQPGDKVRLSFTASPATGSYVIATAVKQANEFNGSGNDLTRVGSDPTVVVGGDCRLVFVTQPGDALIGEPIPGASGGSPRVGIQDGAGNAVSLAGVTVSMALDGGVPEGSHFTTTSTTTAVTDAAGVASFDNLRVASGAFGLTLVATDVASAFETATSEPFSVVADLETQLCDAGEECSAQAGSLEDDELSVAVRGTAVVDGSGMSVTVAPLRLNGGCEEIAGVSRIPSEITLTGVGAFTSKTAEIRIAESYHKAQPNNGVSFYQICAQPLEPSSEFVDRYTGEKVEVGQFGYLPDCFGAPSISSGGKPPCILDRSGSDIPEIGVVLQVRWGSRLVKF